MSVARCAECLNADAIPLWVAVANTAAIGGLSEAASWWKETVADTLTHLNVTQEVFDAMVAEVIEAEMNDVEPPTAEGASK